VPVVVQQKWAAATCPSWQSQPGFAQAFLPWGRAPEVGELFQFPAAARALRLIAETKGEAFYAARSPRPWRASRAEHGGAITAADFAALQAGMGQAHSKDYRGHTLHEIPPNGQGIAALIALGILENFDLAAHQVDGADSQHLQIEAMKLAFADTYRYVAELRAWR
jgi:gamma-glutamyltranspeptidase/glutathione hydrolase